MRKHRSLISGFRNVESERVAKRLAAPFDYSTLDVKINIDDVLAKRSPETATLVLAAIDARMPFILYNSSSPDHYCVVNPMDCSVMSYRNGKQIGLTIAPDIKQFSNNIKLAIVVYDKFFIPVKGPAELKAIEGTENSLITNSEI